jgi:hypothetical protein
MSQLPVPYSQPIHNFQHITISGSVNAVPVGGKRFEVNLKSNENEHILHFNVRFDEGCVVRNSTKNGQQWQNEERDGVMPFSSGQPFVLELVNPNNGIIQCLVNGQSFCEYVTRDNLNEVALLEVAGDVQLESVSDGSESAGREPREVPEEPQPEQPPIVQPVPSPPVHPEPAQPQQPQPTQPVQPAGQPGDLSVPYHGPLQDFVRTNRMRIVGVPIQGQTNRFIVNMKDANGETLFHFNPRFDQNCVVRTFTQNHQFQAEEREGGPCPFQIGKTFALDFIVANGNVIRCFVDGIEFCQFNVHHDLSQVSTLDILGDVQLSQILIV